MSSETSVPLAERIHSMARAFGHGGSFTDGDLAALRRMDPRVPDAPAFWKVHALFLDDIAPAGGDAADEFERRWAALVVGLAHLRGLHRKGAHLGRACAAAGLSELRFSRLLRAEGDALQAELLTLARFASAKAEALDWSDAARLVFLSGEDGERVRRRIAREYFSPQIEVTPVTDRTGDSK